MQSPKRIEPVENEQADYHSTQRKIPRLKSFDARIERREPLPVQIYLANLIISLLVLDWLDSFWRLHGLPPAMVLKSTRKGHCLEAKAPSLGMPKTFAQPLPIRRNIENSYH